MRLHRPSELSNDDQAAALASEFIENEDVRKGLFARLGGEVSRHSRPLLIAAAAILLAITTLQLAKNPNSSLHGLFNSKPIEQTIPAEPVPADEPAAPGEQSSMMPSSGNLVPDMTGEEASRAITFAQPSGAQGPLNGPSHSKAIGSSGTNRSRPARIDGRDDATQCQSGRQSRY